MPPKNSNKSLVKRSRGRPKKEVKDDDDDEDISVKTSSKRRGRPKKEVKDDDDEDISVKTSSKRRGKKRKAKEDDDDDEDDEDISVKTSSKRRSKKRKAKKDDEDISVKTSSKLRGKKRKVKEEEEEEEVNIYDKISDNIKKATKESEFKKITSEISVYYNRDQDQRQDLLNKINSRKQEIEEKEIEKQRSAAKDIKEMQESFNKIYGMEKNPLNGINKISAKGINNYIILNYSELMVKNSLFNSLYEYVKLKYPNDNEDSVLEKMLLMLDSVHDFIGERTTLTYEEKELMIKTMFQINDDDAFIYNFLKNLRAGEFENELFLWLLYIKKNKNLDIVKNVLFGDIISIAEQTKKDNLSSLFTIDAFNKSFEAYRKTLYYLSSDVKKENILENTNKNINDFLFRIKIIELYNTLRDALKNEKIDKEKWDYAIHILRNYIINYNFQNLKLKETNNDSQDLLDNIDIFFSDFLNYYGFRDKEYYIEINVLETSINNILNNIKNLSINDFDKVDIISLLKRFLEKIKDMKTEEKDVSGKSRIKIQKKYDSHLSRYENKSQDAEDVIVKALENAGKNQIETIINDSKEYIQFVAIPPQLFDANESTGGENMKILGIKSTIKMIPQSEPFKFKLLGDNCTLKYDRKNYIFDIYNDNYPIKRIDIIAEGFNISGYKVGWKILLEKYAYKEDEKQLVCNSCPGVTDLFDLYKYFDEEKNYEKKDVLNNIFQIKRAGDYSQIKFCKEYNDKQKKDENKLLFLSNDRMSSSFCLLLKVPFVAPVYSGVMGSETFCVYYNPYVDRTRLYDENRTPITDEDIKELIIKLKILNADCNNMDASCNIEKIKENIKKLEEIEKDADKYTLLSRLLVAQEIYDNNKYIVEKQKQINVAACRLTSMKIGYCLIESPDSFFNNDQKIKYNLLYKQLNKLYYYIQSLSMKEPVDKELNNYVELYYNIQKDVKEFLNIEKGVNGLSLSITSTPIKQKNKTGRITPPSPRTPQISQLLALSKEYPEIIYEEEEEEEKSQNLFDSNPTTQIKYIYNPLTKDISLKKYKHYNTVMFYNEKGYLLVQDFNPSAVIKINSIKKAKEQIYPDGTKITFKLN